MQQPPASPRITSISTSQYASLNGRSPSNKSLSPVKRERKEKIKIKTEPKIEDKRPPLEYVPTPDHSSAPTDNINHAPIYPPLPNPRVYDNLDINGNVILPSAPPQNQVLDNVPLPLMQQDPPGPPGGGPNRGGGGGDIPNNDNTTSRSCGVVVKVIKLIIILMMLTFNLSIYVSWSSPTRTELKDKYEKQVDFILNQKMEHNIIKNVVQALKEQELKDNQTLNTIVKEMDCGSKPDQCLLNCSIRYTERSQKVNEKINRMTELASKYNDEDDGDDHVKLFEELRESQLLKASRKHESCKRNCSFALIQCEEEVRQQLDYIYENRKLNWVELQSAKELAHIYTMLSKNQRELVKKIDENLKKDEKLNASPEMKDILSSIKKTQDPDEQGLGYKIIFELHAVIGMEFKKRLTKWLTGIILSLNLSTLYLVYSFFSSCCKRNTRVFN